MNIEIGKSLRSTAFVDLCKSFQAPIALFVDRQIVSTHGEPLLQFLKQHSLSVDLLPLPAGESAKTRKVKEELEDECLKRNYGRHTLFIGLGGGSTTDLVGYLASTYLRGVPVLFVPTTLLGMVDASIGGKNGVNTPQGKNLIGTFYPPRAVWMDLATLETLPKKEWLNGFSEVLKYGLTLDRDLWQKIEKGGFQPTLELVKRSVDLKMKIVERDPTEAGLRSVLNFGHTVGHALEKASQFALPHGEAVAIGCIAECYLSHRLGTLPLSEVERVLALYRKLGYPLRLTALRGIKEAMSWDKKAVQGQIRSVLIEAIGQANPFDGAYCTPIEEREIDETLKWLAQTLK